MLAGADDTPGVVRADLSCGVDLDSTGVVPVAEPPRLRRFRYRAQIAAAEFRSGYG